jgi:hypothetical protein
MCTIVIGERQLLHHLFVYSTNTTFGPTESANTHGYNNFHVFGLLDYDEDLTAAAPAIRKGAAR